jgi:glutathione S-transferase
VTNNFAKFDPLPEQTRMFGYGNYAATVDVLEQAVSAHPYIAGERFTAADVYVGSAVGWGTLFGTLPKRDAFTAYFERLSSREAFQRAAAKDDALVEKAPA